MSEAVPLGQKENERLELKARASLETPEDIAREVVAMLNAEGGEVWIGLREEGGRAVAIDPVPDPDQEERQLRDYLMDKIEPSPSDRELRLVRQNVPEGTVFRLIVNPDEGHKPYALLKKGGGRLFMVRVGDRLRPLSREELSESFRREGRHEERLEQAISKLLLDRKAVQESGRALFWLAITPVRTLEIDLHDRRLEDYLQQPALTGNRESGWNFSQFERRPRIRKERLFTDEDEWRRVEIRKDGTLIFEAPLESLYWKGKENEIWPFILLEYPASAFRLARKVYEGALKPQDLIVADLALLGVRGWSLRPYSPRTWGFSGAEYRDSPDLVWEKPLTFRYEEVEADDRCAFRLVERVYEAFGFRRDAIPQEFDRKTGRLILPE